MGWAGVISAALLALPCTGLANSLTLNLWPDDRPESVVSCTLSLSDGKLSAVEAKGLGLINPRPLRWWASPADTAAFLSGLQALVDGTIPSQNPLQAPRPAPPFLTVTWIANLDGRIASGRYTDTSLALPPAVAALWQTVIPFSYCLAAAPA